jgi:CBS domain-containing protein
MLIKEVMTKGIDSVGPHCTVVDAAKRMKRHHIGILPVIEGKRLTGVVTDRDIVVRAVAKGASLQKTTVAEIMTLRPFCCGEMDELRDVARFMEEKKVRRLPVMNDDRKLVGLVSLDDFGKRFAAQDLAGEVLEAMAARRG